MHMWIVLAIISAVFAGLVSVTVKAGMKNVDSNLSTFLRTSVVLVFTLVMTLIIGSLNTIQMLTPSEWFYIMSSGICTGLSWLCYFRALKTGEINKVVAIDKLSTVLTMILAIIIFSEPFWWLTFVAMGIMLAGTMLMINNKKPLAACENLQINETKEIKKNWFKANSWLVFAILSLIFASLTSILAKLGMQNIDSHLGTFLRTIIVFLMAFFIVLGSKKLPQIKKLTKLNWLFLTVSGVFTGVSWVCYYAAVQTGVLSVVVPIDKLSILVAVLFSYFVFKEKISAKAWLGLILLTAGTLLLLL